VFCHAKRRSSFGEDVTLTNLVPIVAVEREVDMKVLVMIIVKYGVWLPGLPPVCFEVYARMVDDAVVVCVQQYDR
jgi:hypothetical protein